MWKSYTFHDAANCPWVMLTGPHGAVTILTFDEDKKQIVVPRV